MTRCALVLLALQQTAAMALAPARVVPAPPPASQDLVPPAVTRSAAALPERKQKAASPSGWVALTPAQQRALAPLAGTWDSLSRAQQRKWLALSKNYPRLQPPEQDTLHSRMSEWTRLSTRERAQARLNFGEAKRLSTADKKALWEAYQALPAEEKSRLATGAPAEPPTTAAAVRPVARQKLTRVPAADFRGPRIASASTPKPGADDAQSGPMAVPAPLQTH